MLKVIAAVAAMALCFSSAATAEGDEFYSQMTKKSSIWDHVMVNPRILVFAEQTSDEHYQQQLQILGRRAEDFRARNVLIYVDPDPSIGSSLRETMKPEGFLVALLAKDGRSIVKESEPVSAEFLLSIVDRLPEIQREFRERVLKAMREDD